MFECEAKESIHGTMAVLSCIGRNGLRRKLIAPERFADESLYPCLMVYLAKAECKSKKGAMHTAHRLRRYGGVGDTYSSLEAMSEKARQLREMPLPSLEQLFNIKRLRDFEAPHIFVYSEPRKQSVVSRGNDCSADAGEEQTIDAWVVVYETTTPDGQDGSGEVFVPSRYAERLQENPLGIMIYRGIETSKNGREYYDVAFLSSEDARRVTMG